MKRSLLLLLLCVATPGCPIRHRPPPWVAERAAEHPPEHAPTSAAEPPPAAAPAEPQDAPAGQAAQPSLAQQLEALRRRGDALEANPTAKQRDALLAALRRYEEQLYRIQERGDPALVDASYDLLDEATVLRDRIVRVRVD